MENKIAFSVIIPLYNKEKDILNTITSLLKQTYTNFEVIVVNDGSTDASETIVKSIKDPRIILFSKQNEGVAKTRNYAVKKVNTEHIVFLDADDFWHPNHLDNLYNLILSFPNHLWYATAYEKKVTHKLIIPMNSPVLEKPKNWMGSISNYFELSLADPLAWTSAVCFKKDFFTQLNGFNAAITMGAGEDTDLWLRAALEAPLAFSCTITARHNLDSSNRISHAPTLLRKYMNLDSYEPLIHQYPYLKQYLDINRFFIGLSHKLAGDKISFKNYIQKIDANNLSKKQKIIMKLPRPILLILLKIKGFMTRVGIQSTTF
ncbi:MAG: glycosyltransferase family A protein [Flavobacteriaceae bacterium]